MSETDEVEAAYHAKDAIGPAVKAAGVTGFAGVFAASVQATLARRNLGALTAFTRYGSTIAVFAAIGGSYEFFKTATANLRQKDDAYNEAVGGFVAGSVIGLRARTIPAVFGYGVALAVTMAAYNTAGGHLFGQAGDDAEQDEYLRKEGVRHNRRRPIQETISELGEGRGIYGPGYQERRRERIKERYGIDVPSSQ